MGTTDRYRRKSRKKSNPLPWVIAGIAIAALVAVIVGFSVATNPDPTASKRRPSARRSSQKSGKTTKSRRRAQSKQQLSEGESYAVDLLESASDAERKAIYYYDNRDYDKAISACSLAIRNNPSELAYCIRGSAWATKNEYNKAIADYSQAIKINPRSFMAYGDRGKAWLKKRDYNKAIADCSRSIKLAESKSIGRTVAIPYFTRGLARQKIGQRKGAAADFAKHRELVGKR